MTIAVRHFVTSVAHGVIDAFLFVVLLMWFWLLLPRCVKPAKEIRQCSCGTQRLVNIKNNLCEMEQAARQFEKEDGILEELCREPTVTDVTNINGAVLEESMFDSNDYMSYVWDVDLKDDLLAAPHTLCPDTQAADVVQGPVKRYSSVSVIVNKSTSNLQSFSRATRALGSLSCVPHFGTPVQAVPVEVLPPDEPDHGHLAPVVPLTIVEAPPCQRVDERDVVDEKLSKSCTCSSVRIFVQGHPNLRLCYIVIE